MENHVKLAVISAIFLQISAYPQDAPKDLCDHLKPGSIHETFDPQTTPFEFKAIPQKDTVKPLEKIEIVLKGPRPFKGFVVVVKEGSEPLGHFEVSSDHPHAKTFSCNKNEANAASHNNNKFKDEVKLQWVAPDYHKNADLKIYLTVIEEFGKYWQNQPAGDIKIRI